MRQRAYSRKSSLLRDAGLGSGARVLDVGYGSVLLARTLRAEGFAVARVLRQLLHRERGGTPMTA